MLILLDQWAATKAPPALQTNGNVLWEYTTPGVDCSCRPIAWAMRPAGPWLNPVNYTGPDATGQALIPDNIKKARFDLYLVV